MRKTAKEILELIQDKVDQMNALQKVADEDDRDFTPEEQAQFDGLLAEIGCKAEDGKPATGLWLRHQQAERYESAVTDIQNHRGGLGGDQQRQPVAAPRPTYSHRALRAFANDASGREQAYRAGQFFAATCFGNTRARQYCDDHGIYAAQSEGDNSLGGFLVPTEVEAAIINLREERGVFRREARVVPMGSDQKKVPKRTGGVTAYWGSEAGSMTPSDKSFGEVNLVAQKLYSLVYYSNELNDDAMISIGDDLTTEIAYAFADKEDEAGFNGDGTSTYGGNVGVLNAMAAGSIYTAASGNTAFATLDLADFEGVVGQLPQYAVRNAKWYISRVGAYQSMIRLMDAGGGNTNATLAAGAPMMFLGFPVVFTQVLNAVITAQASTAIAAFGDLQMGAILGNRKGISVMISEHARFTNDQLAIRGTERVDINVHEVGTASVAGSLIVLKTPAA